MTERPKKSNDLWRYAGLGTQIFVSLGIAVYLGHLVDENWLKWKVPLATILFPLLVLVGMIYSLLKQTSRKK